jgi:hypothetical protein
MAHAFNPSYSRGRDQEDPGLKPAQKLVLWKTLHKNRADGVAQSEGPEFKSQYHKKKSKLIVYNVQKLYNINIFNAHKSSRIET